MLREDWDEIVANGPALLQSMHAAGIRLVAGTDAQMGGFELQRELELYVEAGVPAPDVLAIATLGAARVMGMDHDLGSIEPGKLADLVVIDGDPLADIRDSEKVAWTMLNGRLYEAATMNQVAPNNVPRRPFFFELTGGDAWQPETMRRFEELGRALGWHHH
jgi:imidazolonepropionase-like amidohydrolase